MQEKSFLFSAKSYTLAAWNGGCRSQRLCRGRPSVPAKSSNLIRLLLTSHRSYHMDWANM
eukprot:2960230-Amphidinium_carterae.1